MKKIIFTALAILFAVSILFSQETVTQDIKQLPKTAQEFIKKHFSKEKIARIKIDKEILETDYEVTFENGTEIDFAGNGEWTDIDCKMSAVPSAVIPAKILTYVNQNYKELSIRTIEKSGRHYDVELSNDLDLEFDKQGNFVRIDD